MCTANYWLLWNMYLVQPLFARPLMLWRSYAPFRLFFHLGHHFRSLIQLMVVVLALVMSCSHCYGSLDKNAWHSHCYRILRNYFICFQINLKHGWTQALWPKVSEVPNYLMFPLLIIVIFNVIVLGNFWECKWGNCYRFCIQLCWTCFSNDAFSFIYLFLKSRFLYH